MALLDLRTDVRSTHPEFDHGVELEHTATIEPGSAVVIGTEYGYQEVRRFSLEWPNATEGVMVLVRNLFQAAGSTQAMNYVSPDTDPSNGQQEITQVRFLRNTLSITRLSATLWRINADVEEVP